MEKKLSISAQKNMTLYQRMSRKIIKDILSQMENNDIRRQYKNIL
nr:MAG TPA: hypothetical protein [Caudoviricetes sp.]